MAEDALYEEARQWRLDLHRHPELGFQEHRTSDFVAARLAEFGLTVQRGIGRTGVVGTLSRGTSRRTVGLRADMDALPIAEETGAAHASVNPGVMHACGHDGHTAMLLAAARSASLRDDIDGTVHFIFQPAEEVEGGANEMVQDGLFTQRDVDSVYAFHNWPALAPGAVVARDGAMMAAFGIFDVAVTGRGAHGAMPHEGADPVVAAAQIVSALQAVCARNVSPLRSAVLSVTRIEGGHAYNVIPETVRLAGTGRWFDEDVGDLLERRLRETATALAQGFGCRADVDYQKLFPATVNDPASAALLRRAAAGIGLSVVETDPSMASEDFAYMLAERPGAYLWLGAGREGDNPGLHSPRFDFNDAVIPDGVRLWNETMTRALAA